MISPNLRAVAADATPYSRERHLREPVLRGITVTASLAAHVIVLVHSLLVYEALDLPPRFLPQFVFLVSASAAAVLAGVPTRDTVVTVSLIAFRAFCVLVATAPLGSSFVVKVLLYMTLVVEVMRLRSTRTATIVCVTLVTMVVLAQRDFVAWSRSIEIATTTEWIALSLATAASGALALYTQLLVRDAERDASQIRDLRDRTRNLVAANLNLQRQSLDAQLAAASEERRRVTRDIHDTVCYAFSCIIMMMNDANLAVQQSDLEMVGRLHSQTMEISRESLKDTRVSLRLIRDLERYDQPISTRLQKLTNAFQMATGTRVRVHFASLPAALTPTVDEAIQRLIQEALANSVRHGHCGSVEIVFGLTDDELTVAVTDDGESAVHVTEGIGLAGMRERVESMGGVFATQAFNVGFEVTARFPLRVALVAKGEPS